MLRLNQGDDRRALAVCTGQELELRLVENPTAGFRWRTIEPGEPVCTLVDHHFEAGSQPGEPGVHLWRFKTIAAGCATIELDYRRAWDAEGAEARVFRLEVRCGQATATA